MSSRNASTLLVAGFLVGVAGVGVVTIAGAAHDGNVRRRLPEQRLSAALPARPTTPAEWNAFAPRFEAWFGDRLAGRDALLGARSRLLVGAFGVSPTPTVHLGRDGWVFLTEARQLETQRGLHPFRPMELERWALAIEARARWCAERGIAYVFALVPDKTDVYRDRHGLADDVHGPTRFDALARRLTHEPAFLDLRPVLAAERARDGDHDHTYFPYGSHWTDRGACAGANAIVRRLEVALAASRNPARTPLAAFDASHFVFEPGGIEGDSWADRLYLSGVWIQREPGIGDMPGRAPIFVEGRGEESARNVTESGDPALPRLCVFHDSFGIPLVKFLARRASRGVFLRGDPFRPEVVAAEAPEAVIEVFCERVLTFAPLESLPEQVAAVAARFERARPGHYVFEPDRDLPVIGGVAGVEATRVESGVRVQWPGDRALAPLPAAFLPPVGASGECRAIARIECEAEGAGELLVFHTTVEQSTPSRDTMYTRDLAAGRNVVYVDLDRPGLRGPIQFRVTRPVGSVVLRAIEVRRPADGD